MYKELDTVILTHDIEEFGLKKGVMGAIVHIHEGGKGYEVEFVDSKSGRTIALLSLYSEDITKYSASTAEPAKLGTMLPFNFSVSQYVPTIHAIKESFIVGTTSIVVNRESDRSESKAAYYNLLTT